MRTIKDLQNGSDIRGIAIETTEHAKNLGTTEARQIACGILNWFAARGIAQPKLAIGVDSRLTGPSLKEAMIEQFVSHGAHVLDCQMGTTPAMFMATQLPAFDCDGGIMLTASHLPFYFNGIKVFSKSGGSEKADIAWILSHVDTPAKVAGGSVTLADLITPYAKDMVAKIRQGLAVYAEKPLAGSKIIVDAGNGAGGFFAEKVLQELGVDTTGSQFLEPDGHFPNHMPNPDNKEAMASIQAAVLREKADLGVIFDTDVDRSALVSADGTIINRNNLIALLAAIILEKEPGATIVTNSPTSDHLKIFIEARGGKQYRYLSGYRNVINKMTELNQAGIDCPLAIETSGHAAFRENYSLDDGAYVIAKILMLLPTLAASEQTLMGFMSELEQPAETLEIRFALSGEEYRATGNAMIEKVRVAVTEISGMSEDDENDEGVRVTLRQPFGRGWFLLRMSLHEPLLVFQLENDEVGHFPAVLAEIRQLFQTDSKISLSKLDAYTAGQ